MTPLRPSTTRRQPINHEEDQVPSIANITMVDYNPEDFENVPSPNLSSDDEFGEPVPLERSFYSGRNVFHDDDHGDDLGEEFKDEMGVISFRELVDREALEEVDTVISEVARRSSLGSESSMTSMSSVTFDKPSRRDPHLDIEPLKVVKFQDISKPNDIVCDREEWERIKKISDRSERSAARKAEIIRMAKRALDPFWMKGGLKVDVYKRTLKRIVDKTLQGGKLVSRAFVSKCVHYEVQKSLENVTSHRKEE